MINEEDDEGIILSEMRERRMQANEGFESRFR